MPRYYSKIKKKEFLDKISSIIQNDEYPYNLPKIILKDLSKVNFDFENYSSFKDDIDGIGGYSTGYKLLNEDFHIFVSAAGGDWEYPVCFIFYWDGKNIRAYIPREGNAWNHKEKCAFVSDEEDKISKLISMKKIYKDISLRIKFDENKNYKNENKNYKI